jgi:hypothetical protein
MNKLRLKCNVKSENNEYSGVILDSGVLHTNEGTFVVTDDTIQKTFDLMQYPLNVGISHSTDEILKDVDLDTIAQINSTNMTSNKIVFDKIDVKNEKIFNSLFKNKTEQGISLTGIANDLTPLSDGSYLVGSISIDGFDFVGKPACKTCKTIKMENKDMSEEINKEILAEEVNSLKEDNAKLKELLKEKTVAFEEYMKKDRKEELKEFTAEARKEIQAELKAESHIDTLISQGIVLGKDKEIHLAAAIRDGLDEYKRLMGGVARAVPLGKQSKTSSQTLGAAATSLNAQQAAELDRYKISLEMGNIKEKDIPKSILSQIKGE